MPLEDYSLAHSAYEIWRADNMDVNLEVTLQALESEVDGKANANHTHSGYANTSHSHSEYANASHTHTQEDVTDLATALSNLQAAINAVQNALGGKAAASHTHAQSEIADLATALSDLQTAINGKAATNHGHSYNDLSDKPTIPTTLPANGGNADTVDNKHAIDFAVANHNHNYAASSHTHTSDAVGFNSLSVGTFTEASSTSAIDLKIRYNDYKAVLWGTFTLANDLAVGTSATIATGITEAVRPGAQSESSVSYFGNRPLLIRITSGGELQVRNAGTTALAAGSSITFRLSYPIF